MKLCGETSSACKPSCTFNKKYPIDRLRLKKELRKLMPSTKRTSSTPEPNTYSLSGPYWNNFHKDATNSNKITRGTPIKIINPLSSPRGSQKNVSIGIYISRKTEINLMVSPLSNILINLSSWKLKLPGNSNRKALLWASHPCIKSIREKINRKILFKGDKNKSGWAIWRSPPESRDKNNSK